MNIERIALANAICKLIGYTAALYLTNMLWSHALYQTAWPIVITAITLMLVGVAADFIIVPFLGAFWSLLPGLPGMVVITLVVAHFSRSAHLTWLHALTGALIIAPLEYSLHRAVLANLRLPHA